MRKRGAGELYKPERMLAFSDGVIAVAITLLVLDLKVPASAKGGDESALLRDLTEMWPSVSMYVLSFFVIGLMWFGHHRKFSFIRQIDRTILWLNLLFLMTLGLVPFATALLSQNATRAGMVLYSGMLCLTSLLSAGITIRAVNRPGLIDPALPEDVRRDLILSPALAAVVFALSVGLAFVNVNWARYALFLLIPASNYAGSPARRAAGKAL